MGGGCGGISVVAAKSTRCSCNGSPQQGQTGSGSRTSIGGGGPLVGPRQSAEGEASLTRLASRAFGLGLALALGKGSGLSLRVACALLELGLQGGILGPQGRDLRQQLLNARLQDCKLGEHLSDERQECLFPQSREFGERRHEADL